MNGTVMVALDGSTAARRALIWAWDFARTTGRRLRVVHTWRGDPAQVYVPTVELDREQAEAARADAHAWIAAAGVDPTGSPDWQLEVARGAPGPTLVAASARDADTVLVVGTHEHRGLGRVLHGSVSHYVLSHASCPVVAVPPPATAPGPDLIDAGFAPVELPDVPRF